MLYVDRTFGARLWRNFSDEGGKERGLVFTQWMGYLRLRRV